ncbi:uroporphyrinogen-III C-methyltransferase [Hydrogenophaga sp.]|uniref:uroporphyrinogen-III C-methyltransferase n=1 Tax=Hydrogenophaga sp. TaxID=1904254 RepID=UPI00286DF84D|nr:uroporphyrinogen-III C-methyltransferase [Hydrogenophaga sp.]
MNLVNLTPALTAPRPSGAAVPPPGTVTLLGAGPGDPELLTVKAVKALQAASLVLYDHLVSPAVLDHLSPSAERIYVGKESSRHTLPQDDIIELMLRLARSGRSLLRLKGGDGYIFGRGGEEAQALAAEGIPFTVIPGLTAAQGAAASVGIPLTHRDHAASLVLATGHLRDGQGLDMDWAMLARPRQTVVLYMGVNNLPEICRQLVAHGLPGDTPAALVEKATLPDERCITGTVAELPSLALRHQVRPPALIMIGSVVSVRAQLMPTTAPAATTAEAADEVDTALHAAA